MRVAYQAGAIRALVEHGYRFAHIDGSSGGIMNSAMVLSGIDSNEMIQRWESLNVKAFASLMPFSTWLAPLRMPAVSSTDGIRETVFPHLGIDVSAVNRQRDIVGTFNVANFSKKVVDVLPNDQVSLNHLLAGVSLPIVMPAIEIDGDWYTDAVWISDANLLEAVRRGADEIWVIWCIGNTKRYKDGFFNQYVHMIEMSANGNLFYQLDRIRELNEQRPHPIVVHMICPKDPIPLDPDFFLGRVTAAELIEMGYSDARRYIADLNGQGIQLNYNATAMNEGRPGLSFRETMSGWFSFGETDPAAGAARGRREGSRLTLRASIDIRDLQRFLQDPDHASGLYGHVSGDGVQEPCLGFNGVFKLFSHDQDPAVKLMVYETGFRSAGIDYYFAGKKIIHRNAVLMLWSDTTTLYVQIHKGSDASGPVIGAGILRLGVVDLVALMMSMHATNAERALQGSDLIFEFFEMFVGELWSSYLRGLFAPRSP